jgi:plastocyanin
MESKTSRLRTAACAATILLLAWKLAPLQASAATLALTVHQLNGKPLPGAVITLDPVGVAAHRIAPVHRVMDQIDRGFVPDILVLPAGSTVEFPNSDSVRHQIYSFSAAKNFQLPLYYGKAYPPVTFDQPGLVTLGCNIHDFMVAYIVVTDAPYFGMADSVGSWSTELPAGSYRLTVWHPRIPDGGRIQQQISIAEGDRPAVTVAVPKSLEPSPLMPHPHSWDVY